CIFFVFFFQAEDGIRDSSVTGVQTCALPISTRVVFRVTDEFGAIRPFANDAIKLELEGPAELIGDHPFAIVGGAGAVWIRAKERSEERRVGKEGGSRESGWCADQKLLMMSEG